MTPEEARFAMLHGALESLNEARSAREDAGRAREAAGVDHARTQYRLQQAEEALIRATEKEAEALAGVRRAVVFARQLVAQHPEVPIE